MLRRGPWRAQPEPRAQAGRPRRETAVVWTKMAAGSWEEGDRESGTRRSQNPQDTGGPVSGMRGKEESRRVHWFGLQEGQWCVSVMGNTGTVQAWARGAGQQDGEEQHGGGRGVDREGPLCTLSPASNTALPPPGCLQVVTQAPRTHPSSRGLSPGC